MTKVLDFDPLLLFEPLEREIERKIKIYKSEKVRVVYDPIKFKSLRKLDFNKENCLKISKFSYALSGLIIKFQLIHCSLKANKASNDYLKIAVPQETRSVAFYDLFLNDQEFIFKNSKPLNVLYFDLLNLDYLNFCAFSNLLSDFSLDIFY
ncbi:MAG: hypothetical protein U5L10_02470 [Candidatus Moranbacteria bacterium]|nr:hypothetical protein [Candidatus Moranbacteria bacterium]